MPSAGVDHIRALAPSEILFADFRETVAYSVFGTGHIDIATLTCAFDALRQTYPVLSCQIIETGKHAFELALPPPRPATIRTSAGPVDEPPAGDDAMLAEDEVCAVDVAQQGNSFRLTLLTHHSIADATASLRYLEVLFALYTRVVETGSTGDISRHSIPKSVEQLLAENDIEKYSLPDGFEIPESQILSTVPPASRYEHREPEIRRGRVRLTVEETAQLLRLAERHGLTVHGIVGTAVLLAAHDLSGVGMPADFKFVSAVDLRTRLSPAVTPEGATCALGVDLATAVVDPDGDIYGLGRTVLDSIAANLANQVIHQGVLHVWDMREQFYLIRHGYPLAGENVVRVTNWGKVPALKCPSGVETHDFRGSFYMALSAERFAPNANAGMTMIATIFQDRLALDYQTWVTEDHDCTVAQTAALQRAFERLLGSHYEPTT